MKNLLETMFKIIRVKSKPEEAKINVGDKMIDNEWGDTIIEIVAINKTGRRIRYKFLKIDGKTMLAGSLHENSYSFFVEHYTKI